MKADIHPNYQDITVTCSCGSTFVTGSTLTDKELNVEICSQCHPFYTGKQKIIDTAKRVDVFNKRFTMFGGEEPESGDEAKK
tara:strand:+ start:25189 stop:25434 length:246 start_codon:yes stop_codon:yes gene_type:complete